MSTQLNRARFLHGTATVAGLAATALLSGGGTRVEPTSAGDPHVDLIQRYYQAYAGGDPNALRPFFAPDIRWTIPGHHPLSGVKTGVDEVLAFFGQLAKAGFRAEPLFLAADRGWVVDLHRGWSTTPTGLDILWALAFRIDGDRIAEAVNFAADQHAADAFFWQHFRLAALPHRLAPG